MGGYRTHLECSAVLGEKITTIIQTQTHKLNVKKKDVQWIGLIIIILITNY
jgi:hypothetical protein